MGPSSAQSGGEQLDAGHSFLGTVCSLPEESCCQSDEVQLNLSL